jgi:hypothetical protein
MRTELNKLLTQKTLAALSVVTNEALFDMIDHQAGLPESILTKNLCVKVTPGFNEKIEEICATLSMTKRRFIEACLVEGIQQAEKILEEEGFYEALEVHQGGEQEAAA